MFHRNFNITKVSNIYNDINPEQIDNILYGNDYSISELKKNYLRNIPGTKVNSR